MVTFKNGNIRNSQVGRCVAKGSRVFKIKDFLEKWRGTYENKDFWLGFVKALDTKVNFHNRHNLKILVNLL